MNIAGKTALVLGAAKGIGREISMELGRLGARLAVTYFDWPEESKTMRRQLEDADFDHLALRVDLRRPEEVAGMFEKIRTTYGGLDILINNIERGGMPVVHGPYSESQWDLEMETTLKAKWWVAHHALPLLKSAPEGVLINLSSIAAIVGRSGPAGLIFNDGYAAANRSVSSFTETWAREGAPSVRVNELMLGFFETRHGEGTRGWGLLQKSERQALTDRILMGRTGRIAEIVRAVLFLIEEATYMTGSVLRLDGGYVLGGERVPPMPGGVVKE